MKLNCTILSIHPVVDGEHESQFMAIHNGQCVGRVGCWVIGTSLAGIRQLWVMPDFRRMGVASRLLRCCYEAAARTGHKEVALGVKYNSREARALYQKEGFLTEKIHEDELHMVRCLRPSDITVTPLTY